MPVPPTIALATHNEHKIREIQRICADWGPTWLTIRSADPASFPEVDETEDDYLGNALMKARAVAAATGVPALADDSGIEVDALGGRPGPRSARFAGEGASDAQNLAALLGALKGVPAGGRTARYRCVAALAMPGGEVTHAEGSCEGTLLTKPRGERGFGYDPIFVPDGFDVSAAELAPEVKNAHSHRARAFAALLPELERVAASAR